MGVRLTVRSSWTTRADAQRPTFEFDHARVVVGRSAGSDVTLPHPSVSSTHATLTAEGAGYVLVDEGSTNGTRVNGKTVPAGRPKVLRAGDQIEIGGFSIEVAFGVAQPQSNELTSALVQQLLRASRDDGESLRPQLRVLNGELAGRVHPLPPPPSSTIVGRGDHCDLSLPDADASREHAEFVCAQTHVLVRDLRSKNGIEVDGAAVVETELRDRQEIVVGATRIAFEDPAPQVLREVLKEPVVKMTRLPVPVDPEPEAALPEASQRDIDTEDVPPISDASVDPALEQTPLAQDAPKAPAPPKEGTSGDLVVYILAGAVLAISLAGLTWLLWR